MNLSAQPFHFIKQFDVPVRDSAGHLLKQPWVGGFNAVVMGEIDLNFDGKPDLVVYDQHAEKIFTFLNMGVGQNGWVDYQYAPEFEAYFPEITPFLSRSTMWFRLVDFNGDGLPDLFMSDGITGIRVYKNVSQKPTIEFELYTLRLREELPTGLHRDLFSSALALPSFVDVDGDGALDLLVFGGLMTRTTMFYYRNRSIEKHGHPYALEFALEDPQWGCFRESDVSNQIILDACDDAANASSGTGDGVDSDTPRRKHGEGATVFALKLSGNPQYDLLLADGGYPGITALFNGGTREHARMTHLDTIFPRLSTPVNLLNSPAVSAIDVDGCGEKELIFSPFGGLDFTTESYASIWVYKNMSTTEIADYQLISKRFLQDQMLDFGMGAFPTVVDIDGNGLLDIVVGNYGNVDSAWLNIDTWSSRFVADLTLLKNMGTPTQPEFQIHPLNLTPKLTYSAAVPTFGDINNNGRLDLLIGTECGKILHYENQNPDVFPPDFVLVNPNILQENIGLFLAPQLFDLNGDGLLDLVVGSQRTIWGQGPARFSKGTIAYLQNVGTPQNPEFMLITDSLGSVNVTDIERSVNGYSKPHFFRDNAGNTHLFCGSESGRVFQYINIGDDLSEAFQRTHDLHYTLNGRVAPIFEGTFSAIAVGDFNGDGILDMAVGNHRGGLAIFFGTDSVPSNVSNVVIIDSPKVMIYPNPVRDRLYIQFEEDQPLQCKILDLQGRTVSQMQVVRSGESLDVSGLPPGIYVLKIVIREQVYSQKFIKN
jgi:hypothetical protein